MKKLLLLIFIFSIVGACSPKKINHAAMSVSKMESNWWKERHEKVLSQLSNNPELIMIGNSITHTLDNEDRGEIWEQYLNKYRALNMGFSGDRTENVIWRLQNGELDGIHPKLATLLIGTNNTDGNHYTEITQPEDLAEAIWKICSLIREKLPETDIILLGILPYGYNENLRNNINMSTNKIISAFPDKDPKIHYRDLGYLFVDEKGKVNKELMPDFLHPNAEGHRLMFEALEKDMIQYIGE